MTAGYAGGGSRSQTTAYLMAIAASAAALALAAAGRAYVGPHFFFILLTGVVFSAWFGGRGPGLLTTAICVITASLVLISPIGHLALSTSGELIELAAFALAGAFTSMLLESERRSRRTAELVAADQEAILRQMADGVILADTEGYVRFYNAHARALHPQLTVGITVDGLVRDAGLRDLNGNRFLPDDFPLVRALRLQETVRQALWRVPRHGTRDRMVEGSAAPVRVSDAPYGAVLVMRDVTEAHGLAEERDRLLGEREAAASRAAFFAEASALLSASLDLEVTLASIARLSVTELADWCLVDLRQPEGEVRRVSVTHSDPRGVEIATVLQRHPPSEENPDNIILRVLQEGEPRLLAKVDEGELRRWAHVEEHRSALEAMRLRSLLVVPLVTRGAIRGTITLGLAGEGRRFGPEDVRMIMELANRAAIAIENSQLYAAALAGNKAKADFLAVMSHELRTPLNAIIGYADLLRTGVPEPLPESLRPYVDRTLSASRHLLQLINEVLTFSRIEAGRANIQLENAEMGVILREVRLLLEPLAAEKQLGFSVEWPREAVVMRTDVRKVRQILVNLAANAIKFTEQGAVAIQGWCEGDDVYFTVSDTGIGIEPDNLAHIFEPFWQVEQRTTRRTGGTGLGLSIVRRLAVLLGGDVHIQSAPGAGSTFTVRLPLRLERRRQREDGEEEEPAVTSGESHGSEA